MDSTRRRPFPTGIGRPNAQCVTGAALGLASMLLPWLGIDFLRYHPPFSGLYQSTMIGPSLNLFEVVAYAFGPVSLFCAVFAIGAVLSLLTPLGGVVQGVGLSGFTYGFSLSGGECRVVLFERLSDVFSSFLPSFVYADATVSLGLGYYLAILSTFIVLQSPSTAVRSAREGPIVHPRIAALAWNTSRTR